MKNNNLLQRLLVSVYHQLDSKYLLSAIIYILISSPSDKNLRIPEIYNTETFYMYPNLQSLYEESKRMISYQKDASDGELILFYCEHTVLLRMMFIF